MPDKRLFQIQNDGHGFYTGFCADGRQVVLGLLCPELVAFFFDAEGNLLRREQRLWSAEAGELAGADPPYQIFDQPFGQLIDLQRQEWKSELGYRAATIQVKGFWDAEYDVGIEILPDYLQDLQANVELDDEEGAYLLSLRETWLTDGKFVWWWAKDYFMSKEGEIDST